MEFSKYYRTVLEVNGVPNLSTEQHKRLFNIIHIEGQLKRIEEELSQFGYNSATFKAKEKLESKKSELYHGLSHPASVFGDMLDRSK
ncbi:MAG: hypothetical protein HRU50_10285 [Winogradskyella sp.]|uniref:hypothetical protein n=1 Tax=Winogradskyella sp. TaxID=1883156 RepID=UPI0025D4B956|nr:hypothetical protein [Winogradskyella sp.]NRB60307.1 hypothetical protein [Winogradskyella sp.]